MAAEVRVLAKQWLVHARSADLPVYKGIGLVLSYPGMPYDEVTSTLDWALALREEAGFRRRHEYHAAWKPLVAQLNDADLLRYAAVGGKLFDDDAVVKVDDFIGDGGHAFNGQRYQSGIASLHFELG